jgi:ribonuclease R
VPVASLPERYGYLLPDFERMHELFEVLRKRREQRGSIDFDLPEAEVMLDESGVIENIRATERNVAHRLIEEFMIMANVAAAETLEQAKTPLIYRVHEEPSKEKLLAFSDYLRTISIPFAKGQVMKPAVFNRILERARGTPHQEVINDVVLRTQAQAVYDTNNVGHFGLNLARYAHFTSPIRRYADLIVHRALIRARHLGDDGLSDR